MRPGITEFSYGYAITEEIIRNQRHFIVGAPIFPSLIQEGCEGGYDLKLNRIGFPLFLQFKLAHLMVRNTAYEIQYYGLLSLPFYRMYLMPLKLSEQHNMLLDLDNGNNEVYYVAPFFTTQEELNNHYAANRVLQNSFLIKPNSIGILPDDNDHHVSVEQYSTFGYLFSDEPKKITDLISPENFQLFLINKLEKESINIDLIIEKTIKTMLEIISKRSKFKDKQQFLQLKNIKPNLGLLTYLSRHFFDIEVILIMK